MPLPPHIIDPDGDDPLLAPSAHLSWRELGCTDGTPYPQPWRASRACDLAVVFEAIRALCGHRPIQVLSGYRTPKYNRRIGGARDSQHCYGRAMDLAPPQGLTVSQFASLIRSRHHVAHPLIRSVGYYPTFIHVDIRPSTRLHVWYGSRQESS